MYRLDESKLGGYEHLARKRGFRVEKVNLNGSFLLKIYGDTQEELNRFKNLYLEGDYLIF